MLRKVVEAARRLITSDRALKVFFYVFWRGEFSALSMSKVSSKSLTDFLSIPAWKSDTFSFEPSLPDD